MHPGMLALRDLNARIGNLRDARVSQVLHRGRDTELTFDAPLPFAVLLHDVSLFVDRGVINAPLVAGIAFVRPQGRVEVWLDDVREDGAVVGRLQVVAARAAVSDGNV
jgi:hypothetical protein